MKKTADLLFAQGSEAPNIEAIPGDWHCRDRQRLAAPGH
jgi:hypothetical protein